MRRREENVRKYAREIMNLEQSSRKADRDNLGGYKVMRSVWRRVLEKLDASLGTSLAESVILLDAAPFIPVAALMIFVFLRMGSAHFGDMDFLY
jgi:hypothetical protein